MNHASISSMNIEILTALAAFAFVSSVTPGPNNLMLMTSGANFGIRRTMPHFLGVVFGFLLMILLLGLGMVEVFAAFPRCSCSKTAKSFRTRRARRLRLP